MYAQLKVALAALPLALACTCTRPAPQPPAGEGFRELRWQLTAPAGASVPSATAMLRYDGTGRLEVGATAQPLRLGPLTLEPILAALERARPFAGGAFGDPACETCLHTRVEVTPSRGAVWRIEQHGEDAGPAEVREVFFGLLHALRPRPVP